MKKSLNSNIDETEIAKFEALASRWWDLHSEFKPLHDINPLRANFIDLHSSIAGKKLIDIGCGGGILAEAMAQRGAIVSGIDMGEAPLKVAKIHQLESALNINYHQSTAENWAVENPEYYDVTCCLEMLEHVPNPASTVHACADLVKPGGHLFFSTINRSAKSYLFAIIGGEYLLKLLPKGTHDYSKFIKPSELASWVRDAGLELKEMTGMIYNPITGLYSLKSEDVSVNYMIHAIKPN